MGGAIAIGFLTVTAAHLYKEQDIYFKDSAFERVELMKVRLKQVAKQEKERRMRGEVSSIAEMMNPKSGGDRSDKSGGKKKGKKSSNGDMVSLISYSLERKIRNFNIRN